MNELSAKRRRWVRVRPNMWIDPAIVGAYSVKASESRADRWYVTMFASVGGREPFTSEDLDKEGILALLNAICDEDDPWDEGWLPPAYGPPTHRW